MLKREKYVLTVGMGPDLLSLAQPILPTHGPPCSGRYDPSPDSAITGDGRSRFGRPRRRPGEADKEDNERNTDRDGGVAVKEL
jgi:hypothetical protein